MGSIDFTCFAASNTASDNITYYVTHRIFSVDLLHSCAHFIFKIDENLASMTVYNDIMIILDSRLFLGHPVDTLIKQLLHCSRKLLKKQRIHITCKLKNSANYTNI